MEARLKGPNAIGRVYFIIEGGVKKILGYSGIQGRQQSKVIKQIAEEYGL
ncbi:MAG: hypothetical protein ACPGJS_12645 [Flammeovirgaceae bacterium]